MYIELHMENGDIGEGERRRATECYTWRAENGGEVPRAKEEEEEEGLGDETVGKLLCKSASLPEILFGASSILLPNIYNRIGASGKTDFSPKAYPTSFLSFSPSLFLYPLFIILSLLSLTLVRTCPASFLFIICVFKLIFLKVGLFQT